MERWNRMNRTIWTGKLSRREANLSPRVHGDSSLSPESAEHQCSKVKRPWE